MKLHAYKLSILTDYAGEATLKFGTHSNDLQYIQGPFVAVQNSQKEVSTCAWVGNSLSIATT